MIIFLVHGPCRSCRRIRMVGEGCSCISRGHDLWRNESSAVCACASCIRLAEDSSN